MNDDLVNLQISVEYRERLRRLAKQNKRSMIKEFEVIIDEIETRRFGQVQPEPQPCEEEVQS